MAGEHTDSCGTRCVGARMGSERWGGVGGVPTPSCFEVGADYTLVASISVASMLFWHPVGSAAGFVRMANTSGEVSREAFPWVQVALGTEVSVGVPAEPYGMCQPH